jgi:hypothetical protein
VLAHGSVCEIQFSDRLDEIVIASNASRQQSVSGDGLCIVVSRLADHSRKDNDLQRHQLPRRQIRGEWGVVLLAAARAVFGARRFKDFRCDARQLEPRAPCRRQG